MQSNSIKLKGGQSNQPPKDTEYVLVKKIGDIAVVRDTDTNGLEIWKRSDFFSGYRLVIDNNSYEFLSSNKNEMKKYLSEMTATGAVSGYSTPYAFSKKGDGNRKSAETLGYKLVNEEDKQILEGKYTNYKKYPIKNETKISMSLREINGLMKKIEELVSINSKLKTESSVSGPLWRRSAKDVSEINARSKNILRGIKEIVRGSLMEQADPELVQNIYNVSIDMLNFQNEIGSIISTYQAAIAKKLVGKIVTIRASKGYGQVEKDYAIKVKSATITLFKEEYRLVLKDQEKKEYYINTAFKIKIAQPEKTPETTPETETPQPTTEKPAAKLPPPPAGVDATKQN